MKLNTSIQGRLNSKTVYLCLLFALLSPLGARSSTVVLKSGMRLNAAKVWEEEGKVKCLIDGLVISFPPHDVERVDDDPDSAIDISGEKAGGAERPRAEQALSPAPTSPPPGPGNVGRAGTEMELEALAADDYILKKQSKHPDKTGKDADAESPSVTVEKENEGRKKSFDREKFSKMLGLFKGRPVTDFMDKWGYPDTIFRIRDGTFEYLFVIEIDPSYAEAVYFKTDSVGKIVGVKSEERRISQSASTEK